MKPRSFNLALAFAILVGTQLSCNALFEEPLGEEPSNLSQPASPSDSSAAPNPAAQGEPGSWLVMLYQNADDEILEEDIFIDLNEAEIVGSTDVVTVVSQMDRYDGAYDGDGDWISAKRYLITQDGDLETIASQEIEDLGEMDSGDSATLVEFAVWAIANYPADNYVLILSDHGAGWTGGWNDDDPYEGSSFSLQNIDDALGEIIARSGIDAFELVGFDACLMGQVEVMSAIAPHARYAVGSEEVEPSLGWAYADFLSALNENPAMNGGDLAKIIVEGYLRRDFRVTDDEARFLFAGGNYTSESVAADLMEDSTLAAIDLSQIQNLNAALNELSAALTEADQSAVAKARVYSQSYESVFGDDAPPSFIDLGHFTELLLSEVNDPGVQKAARAVQAALSQTVLAEMHGGGRPGSSGLSLYFPNSELYEGTFGDDPAYGVQYASFAGRFAAASLWDNFLTYHYTGEPFDPASADLSAVTPAKSAERDFAQAAEESAPQQTAQIAAPGGGEISIAPLQVSAVEIGPNDSVTVSVEVSGSNIGYIYYYVSWYDETSASYLTADMGFIAAENVKQIDGVYYPDWGDDSTLAFDFDWEPTLYFMSDGNPANDQFAFFEPSVYGVSDLDDVYSVRGIFQYAGSSRQIDAVMQFGGDGKMKNLYGFTGQGGAGAPREIVPRPGDTFTIIEQWLDFDQNPDGEFVDYLGGVMTFGDQPFEMVPYYAYSGDYILGVIATDLNGGSVEEFIEVTVTE
ncbi:MAG: clostripain-related cysteine peptidase [Chloroflexi bacterium]|nr:clostripain-related cysteine peptidase [Chloroflexota bacterium]